MILKSEWIFYGTMGGGSVTGDILSRIMRKRIHLKASTLRARSDEVFVFFYNFLSKKHDQNF